MDTPARSVQDIASPDKHRYEVADVFNQYGDEYLKKNKTSISQRKVMGAIKACRTAVLGGHVEECDNCGHQQISYNSCRNRHCPKCQGLARERWVESRLSELLPIGYFHNVFTLPHLIHKIYYGNEKVIYSILFKSVSETLKLFADKLLGGRLSIISILHTWGQLMQRHIHLHCIISGGAMSFDGKRWISSLDGYLFDVKELSKEFQDRYCKHLERAYTKGELVFRGESLPFALRKNFESFIADLRSNPWVVYSKKPFAGPELVVEYIGRYTHRVAISNSRIVSIDNGMVKFKYRDYRDDGKQKEMEFSAEEFIDRFLAHVLPSGFVKIRYYGFLAGKNRKTNIQRCKELLGDVDGLEERQGETYAEILLRLTGVDIFVCPECGEGHMNHKRDLMPYRRHRLNLQARILHAA